MRLRGKNLDFSLVFKGFRETSCFPNEVVPKAILDGLGVVLGRLGAVLGRLGSVLGRCWRHPGAKTGIYDAPKIVTYGQGTGKGRAGEGQQVQYRGGPRPPGN